MPKDTRTYSGHWDDYLYGPEHHRPPSRWPAIRDALLGSLGGVLLGWPAGARLATGEWVGSSSTLAFLGGVVLVVLATSLVVGQLVDSARQDRRALLRTVTITVAVLIAAFLAGLLTNL